jgi:nitrogen fixation/metabolism regulation signal transduction histidine kinase
MPLQSALLQSERLRELYQSSDLELLREEIPRAIDQTLEGAENVARIVRAMKVFSHPGSKELQQIDLNSALESTITVSRNEWKYCAKVTNQFCKRSAQDLLLTSRIESGLSQHTCEWGACYSSKRS